MALEFIAAFDRADARRRTRVDQVAGDQLDQMGKMGNHLRHAPDQLVEVALLAHLAVDLEPDRALLRVADVMRRRHGRTRRRAIEPLSHVPRPARLLGLALQIPARHVETDGVTEDMLERPGDGNVPARLADADHQFDLMVEVGRGGRVRHDGTAGEDGVGGLHEIEGRLAVRVVPHLAGMGGVIAPDAIDAANREHIGRSGDRQRRDGRTGNGIAHGRNPRCCAPCRYRTRVVGRGGAKYVDGRHRVTPVPPATGGGPHLNTT